LVGLLKIKKIFDNNRLSDQKNNHQILNLNIKLDAAATFIA